MGKTMRAIAIRGGKGPADALHVTELPRPVPRDGEILVRVRAAGVNRPAIVQREGNYAPPPGDLVCALLGGGGYAEYAAVDARHALPIPAGLEPVQAAALPETVFTVHANVFGHGALKTGETLLVHGATSGIGVAAIQMAKAAGARVIATSRGADKARAAQEIGADIAVDASTDDFGEIARAAGGVDVALDMVGAPYLEGTLKALNTGG